MEQHQASPRQPPQHQDRQPGIESAMTPRPRAEDHAYRGSGKLHGQAPVSMRQSLGTARFWFESFQNWQSEFLAVGSIVVLSIGLRERGSPESKPVHRAHAETGR